MADGNRTFTEGEHFALVNDAVQRETAAATARVTDLEAELTALKNANDVLVTEKAAEAQRADQAVQTLIDFKDELEKAKELEQRKTTRMAQVAEAAPLLEITEDRTTRIVAMSDEVFETYVSDLREVAAKAPKADPAADAKGDDDEDDKKDAKKKGDLPRESAAFRGGDSSIKSTHTPVLAVLGAGRALRGNA